MGRFASSGDGWGQVARAKLGVRTPTKPKVKEVTVVQSWLSVAASPSQPLSSLHLPLPGGGGAASQSVSERWWVDTHG